MSVGVVNKQTGDRIPTAGMPAIDDALDLTSVNPVQNAIVTAALALKQDKTDNALQTTDKTVVGAVNELKSGLTNYENQNDRNLEVPNRKNLFDPNSNLKLGFSNSIGTNGTFTSGNYYAYVVTKRSVPTFTISGVDYTKMEDASIRVFVSSSYPAVGVAQWRTSNISDLSSKTVTLSENDKYLVFLIKWEDTATQADKEAIMVEEGNTATSYTPYIPSVDARLDAVEERKIKWFNIEVPANATEYDMSSDLPTGAEVVSVLPTGGAGLTIVQYNVSQTKLYFASAPSSKAYARVFYY